MPPQIESRWYGNALAETCFKKLIGNQPRQFTTVDKDASGLVVSREPNVFEDFAEPKGMNSDERADYRKIDDTIGGVRDKMLLGSVGASPMKLGIPDPVANRMQATRALDRKQTGTYSGINVS